MEVVWKELPSLFQYLEFAEIRLQGVFMTEESNHGKTQLVGRLSWGLKWGLRFGIAFSMFAAVMFLFSPSKQLDGHVPPLPQVVAVYMLGGLAAGFIVGALLPLVRWPVGAVAVGCIAAFPVGILVRVTSEGFGPWLAEDTFTSIAFAMLIGGPIGLIYRRIFWVKEQ